MFLLVGLPGAGKTTVARQLARDHRALRLTPDEWMIPLFGDNDADGKRAVLEGRMITIALQLLRIGTSVVLDFGCWSRDERSALRGLSARAGSTFELIYVDVDRQTQLERIGRRWTETPHETFAMTTADVDVWRAEFEPPDEAELRRTDPPDPPYPWPNWFAWAVARWPSLAAD